MKEHADKTSENKSKTVANNLSKKGNNAESTFQFENNRPESIAQRKLQEAINNSPQVTQLKSYQAMADKNSAQAIQRKDILEEESLQEKPEAIQKKENKTGLPNNLKSGIENLSGFSLDDVKVHYNSGKPAQLQAHAYAQGTNIHIASGQEKHLPHEAWHVVQQKQGRVKPTIQLKGVQINDDKGLEEEADVMGASALQKSKKTVRKKTLPSVNPVVMQQRSKNPLRQDTGEYKKQGPGEGAAQIDMTEHHIVPHARLELVKKSIGLGNTTRFMPAWDNVTVRMMVNLKGGWQEEWIVKAGIPMDGLAKDHQAALVQWVAGKEETEADAYRSINRAKDSWQNSFSGGEEPDADWGGAFFEWLPGNIIKGPTERQHDQGDGDALDKELVFLLNQMGNAPHAAKAEEADAAAQAFLKLGNKKTEEDVRNIVEIFVQLNAFGYTEFTAAQRALWEAHNDKFQVIGYQGN
jgi:hypothetical protein